MVKAAQFKRLRQVVVEHQGDIEMNHARWRERIQIAGDLHHGDPCIAGTRVPVVTIVSSLADGMSAAEVMAEYPQLSLEDVYTASAYAGERRPA